MVMYVCVQMECEQNRAQKNTEIESSFLEMANNKMNTLFIVYVQKLPNRKLFCYTAKCQTHTYAAIFQGS